MTRLSVFYRAVRHALTNGRFRRSAHSNSAHPPYSSPPGPDGRPCSVLAYACIVKYHQFLPFAVPSASRRTTADLMRYQCWKRWRCGVRGTNRRHPPASDPWARLWKGSVPRRYPQRTHLAEQPLSWLVTSHTRSFLRLTAVLDIVSRVSSESLGNNEKRISKCLNSPFRLALNRLLERFA